MPDALVVVDMLNTYDHPDGEQCARNVRRALDPMRAAIADARDAGDVVIYVNDHYGSWTSDRHGLIEQVLDQTPDRGLVEPILPDPDDPFLFKARHSIFYETPLEYLLGELECERLTLVGQVTEQCILYSALDAYVRHFSVRIVEDAVAAIDDDLADASIRMMERNMRAEVVRAGRGSVTPG